MPVINREEIVKYTTAQMYDLVNDIEAYPEFLPWCVSSEVHSRDEDEVRASLVLSAGVHKSFTTHNYLQKNKMIEMRLVNGPFKHLHGFWRFDKAEEGQSKVSLDMEFEFSGTLLDLAIGPVFHQIASTLVEAFCERAGEIYVD